MLKWIAWLKDNDRHYSNFVSKNKKKTRLNIKGSIFLYKKKQKKIFLKKIYSMKGFLIIRVFLHQKTH